MKRGFPDSEARLSLQIENSTFQSETARHPSPRRTPSIGHLASVEPRLSPICSRPSQREIASVGLVNPSAAKMRPLAPKRPLRASNAAGP
jgi:hypothetical protein